MVNAAWRKNVLSDGGEVGFEHSGAYAEYLLTEASRLHVLPNEFFLTHAALIEPLAVCMRGLDRLRQFREPTIFFGDGPIGLPTLSLLQHRGIRDITLVGGRKVVLDLAQEWCVTPVVNFRQAGDNLLTTIRHSGHKHFQTLIEASGNPSAMETAWQLAGPCGKILVLGDYKLTHENFPWSQLLHREIELIGSNASAEAFPTAVRIATSVRKIIDRLITHVLPAEHFEEGIELLKTTQDSTLKVVLVWDLSGKENISNP